MGEQGRVHLPRRDGLGGEVDRGVGDGASAVGAAGPTEGIFTQNYGIDPASGGVWIETLRGQAERDQQGDGQLQEQGAEHSSSSHEVRKPHDYWQSPQDDAG